ncbi:hypothetical protein Sjap_001126 [Stephania japonica]|uniref:DYW domain-containing protein n=1 Tax=Stephania japonica TaxID=461633 RepID=A0AAP0KJF0_9MAGN
MCCGQQEMLQRFLSVRICVSLDSKNVFILQKRCFSSFSNINHLKEIHAKYIRNGCIEEDILAIGKLVANISISSPSNLNYARSIVAHLPYRPNVFMWNSLMRGYAQSAMPEEAIPLYCEMIKQGLLPNNYTFPFVLKACAKLSWPNVGLVFHGTIIKRGFEDCDPFIQTSLVYFYASCGFIDSARQLFDRCSVRDTTSWNSLIKGYVKVGRYIDAIRVFRIMQDKEDVEVDEITLLGVVLACSQLGALDMGRWIHTYIDKNQVNLTRNLGTALIDMYARCGCIEIALDLFRRQSEKDVRTWSAMIGGLAAHGLAVEALNLFFEMQQFRVSPDSVILTHVLNACSHVGMVAVGLKTFNEMSEVHNVVPKIEHYGCIVDLLGRAGHLEEALDFIRRVPLKPDVVLWGALLVACRAYKNVEMGEMVAREMLKLDPHHCGAHVFLSNVYASTGRWDAVDQVRHSMKEQEIKKTPGSSLIELDGDVHEFIAGDERHPHSTQINLMLDEIAKLVKLEGHVSATREVALDIDEEEKEQALYRHSEKLAVAFGLINTKQGAPLRVVKNLRVCEDCHSVMKLISKAFNRLIVIRDRSRFHHFKDGSCSCRDYW